MWNQLFDQISIQCSVVAFVCSVYRHERIWTVFTKAEEIKWLRHCDVSNLMFLTILVVFTNLLSTEMSLPWMIWNLYCQISEIQRVASCICSDLWSIILGSMGSLPSQWGNVASAAQQLMGHGAPGLGNSENVAKMSSPCSFPPRPSF